MIKGIILSICFLSICCVGLFINKRYKKRAEFYNEYLKYIVNALESVRSTKSTKEEINKKMIGLLSSDFALFLQEFKIPKYIKKDEANEITSFLMRFGESDLISTIELLTDKKNEVEGKVTMCETELKNKGGLIVKLSVLLGLALVILLV